MKFPREIRLMIFKFLLIEDKQIERPKWPQYCQSPEIFRVYRKIRDEVYEIFYTYNTFKIDPTISKYTTSCFSLRSRL
jgi:hypothetical protein